MRHIQSVTTPRSAPLVQHRSYSQRLEGGRGKKKRFLRIKLTIQISLSSLRNPSSTLGANFNNANLLEGLEDLAVNGAGGVNMVGGTGSTIFLSTVSLAETADADGFAEVDMASDGSCADVEPIHRLRGKLFHVSGLYGIDPACEFL